jgi:hypothetical protein
MSISQTNIKHPKWSLKTQFGGAITITVLSSTVVFLLMKKDIWNELEIIVSILSLFSFIYFFVLFYHGVRFDRNEIYSITWKPFNFNNWADTIGYVDTGGLFSSAGADAGPVGCLIGLFLDLVVSIFLIVIIVFFLWFGLNVFTTGVLILILPLYFLFKRSLRVAVVRAKACHGNIIKSLTYAFGTTVINIAWLYLIIYAGHHIFLWYINRS